MPSTPRYRLKQKDSLGDCRCSNNIGPGDNGWPNQAQTYVARCSELGYQSVGPEQTVTVPAGEYFAATLAAANLLARNAAREMAQELLDCTADHVQFWGAINKVKAQADGSAFILGAFNFVSKIDADYVNPQLWPMLVKLTPNGQLDETFEGFSALEMCRPDGEPMEYEGSPDITQQAYDITIEPTGAVVVVGHFFFKVSDVLYSHAIRFLADGSLDTSFLCRFRYLGQMSSAVVRAVVWLDTSSYVFGGLFDGYAKGDAAFTTSVHLVNIDVDRVAVFTVPALTAFERLWPVWVALYQQGRLYLGTQAPGFVCEGDAYTDLSYLNTAGGGLVRVSLNSAKRVTAWQVIDSIPYFPPSDQNDAVLDLAMDSAGRVVAVGKFQEVGKMPLLNPADGPTPCGGGGGGGGGGSPDPPPDPDPVWPCVESVIHCQDRGGSAVLCGFSEYTMPEIPPRKFRIQTLSGENNFTCSNGYSTNGVVRTQVQTTNPLTCSVVVTGQLPGFCGAPTGGSQTPTTWHEVRETSGILSDGTCGACPYGEGYTITENAFRDYVLTDEDTEDDARTRLMQGATFSEWQTVGVPEDECRAVWATREAGEFSFLYREQNYKLVHAGLTPSLHYNAKIEIWRRPYNDGAYELYLTHELEGITDGTGLLEIIGIVPNDPGFETYAANACVYIPTP